MAPEMGAASAWGVAPRSGDPPRRLSVRARLTVLYGSMFFGAGLVLLTVTYLLVRSIMGNITVIGPFGEVLPDQYRSQVVNPVMHQLLAESLIALVAVGVIAIALGYFVAGRALAPLQQVTATAQRLSESTLHERIALEGPEDEIKELADTFDAMLERLAGAFDAQRSFVANASHELRTPLTINRTLLEVALADPEASADLKVLGKTLLTTNARHQRLIDGLLLLARSERGLRVRTPVDLADVASSAVTGIRPELAEARVNLDQQLAAAPTAGEPVLLEHLVRNLLDNAVKYNAEDGTIWLRTWSQDDCSFVYVANTGSAVAPHAVPRLFEPFRRLDEDRLGSDRGAGLGLSIVASVVRAHGGRINARPREGGGLAITVRLAATPSRPGLAREAPPFAASVPDGSRQLPRG
jgi:signal transduction histidine kinase